MLPLRSIVRALLSGSAFMLAPALSLAHPAAPPVPPADPAAQVDHARPHTAQRVACAEHTVARLNQVAGGPRDGDLQAILDASSPQDVPSARDAAAPAPADTASPEEEMDRFMREQGLSVHRRDGEVE